MNGIHFFRYLALTSFFGLMLTYLAWIIVAPHAPNYPTAVMLIFGIGPLLFPLRGILHGKPYTHAWTSFIMLFYFTHAVGELYSADTFSVYACLATLLSLLCFSTAIIYIKLEAKNRHNQTKNRHNKHNASL